jgi:hypothetical protein
LLLGAVCLGQAADQKYDATITFCNGQKNTVQDFRIVYAWREMPATSEGLTPYKLQTRGEQGLWVVNRDKATPAFKLIPFSDLDSIEFDSDIKQLGYSTLYQFRIQQVRLQRLHEKPITLTDGVLGDATPILWPCHARAKFPEDLGDKRIDRVTVSLQGKTKIEGADSEYLFVFPTSLTEANESLLKKTRDSFPQKIQIVGADGTRTAQAEK